MGKPVVPAKGGLDAQGSMEEAPSPHGVAGKDFWVEARLELTGVGFSQEWGGGRAGQVALCLGTIWKTALSWEKTAMTRPSVLRRNGFLLRC